MPNVFTRRAKLDRRQLEALYRQYAPLVHARARRLVGDDAEDVVQEVFIRLIRRPPEVDSVKGWIFATATNISLDRLRFQARRNPDWYDALRAHRQQGKAMGPDALLAAKDVCKRVMARLDRKTQRVVALVVFDEMTHEEAAELLGISRKTVGERMKRFHERARKMVARWTT